MPERKVKAVGRRVAGLARALLALAAPLALAACLPAVARNSAPPPGQLRPAPAVPVLTEVRQARPDIKRAATPPPAPYGPAAPAETGLAGAGTARMTPQPAAPPLAVPEQAPLHSYHPAPPPLAFTFTSGLIDLYSLMAGSFPGPLVTALAGERLLTAHGLTPARGGEPDPLEAGLLPALGPAPVPAAIPVLALAAPVIPAMAPAAANPAPSAGEPILSNDRPTEFRVGQAGQNGDRTRNLLTAAYEQTGRHYKIGGFSPLAGFDAAGYTHWVFSREGLDLPQTPAGLAAAGVAVTREDLRPGDVLIYRNPADKVGGWHVGIYSGQGNFLHASPKAGVVTETDAFGPQYAPYFQGGRRFFDDPGAAPLSDSQKMAVTSTAVKLALAELGPDDKVIRPVPPKAVSKAKAKAKAAKSKAKKAVKKK